jgi:hypothetical protein
MIGCLPACDAPSGGWLEAQCGAGPNLAGLRRRVAALTTAPPFTPYFADFREPWLFQDAESAAETLRCTGFVNVKTSIEPALAFLEDAGQYTEFVRNIVLRRHLDNIPTEVERAQFTDMLTKQAVHDDPPFSLDYWRLNLRARRGWRS